MPSVKFASIIVEEDVRVYFFAEKSKSCRASTLIVALGGHRRHLTDALLGGGGTLLALPLVTRKALDPFMRALH